MANHWTVDPRPFRIRAEIVGRWSHLEPHAVRALALTVARMIHFRRSGYTKVSPEGPISAISRTLPEWCEMARLALDMANEAAPLDDVGEYAPSAHGPANTRVHRTREEMVDLIRRKAAELGRVPTVPEIDADPNMPVQSSYIWHFGNMANAVRAAGLEPRPEGSRPTWSNQECLERLIEGCRRIGGVPSMAEWDRRKQDDDPVAGTYQLRFGSWSKALRAAGLPPRPRGLRKPLPLPAGRSA
jgi:hypothetical protein